ncbi:transcription initiation factor TFIID subunit 7-like [Vitis riparia]|uniref:transcription initiation factor TFIID subunit 7-like n=1 Tax=Vitis riparia TaxID=96939 RepID=UPI00155AA549|nr:transcription initiation factor TFIID subunit 7-like [Vitis riparia]
MGCFLGCFGYSAKHKRRKPAHKFLQGEQGLGCYEPLESSISVKLDVTEKPITSDSEFRDKPKERSSLRIRKKVSFNLNVTTYEPIPTDDNSTDKFLGSDEEKSWARGKEETEKERPSPEGESVASGTRSYPLNYRYHNCEDSFDENEDLEYEENDLDDEDENDGDKDEDDDDDDDDDDESDGGGNVDDLKTRQEFTKFCSAPTESQKGVTLTQMADEKTNNLMSLHASQDQQLKAVGLNKNARDRSQYVYSVLNPVENLTQWKEIKAKSKPPLKNQRKENIAIVQSPQAPFNFKANKPLLLESPVDASLSNWLGSSEIMPLKEKCGKTDFKGF